MIFCLYSGRDDVSVAQERCVCCSSPGADLICFPCGRQVCSHTHTVLKARIASLLLLLGLWGQGGSLSPGLTEPGQSQSRTAHVGTWCVHRIQWDLGREPGALAPEVWLSLLQLARSK